VGLRAGRHPRAGGRLAGRAGPDGARHPRRAAHLPGARASLLPEEGYLSIALAMFGEIVDELLASAPRPSG
jgi:hypothetical protein